MIPLSLCLAVTVCILNIWIIQYAAGCGDHQVKVNELCCDQCPPGEYVKEFCSENQKTVCSPCARGTYSDHYNFFDRCEECQSCQQEMHGSGGDIPKILGISLVLLSLTLLLFLCCCCIKNQRKLKQCNNPVNNVAVSTNTSAFPLSKEESGVELIIQDVSKNSDSFSHCFLTTSNDQSAV